MGIQLRTLDSREAAGFCPYLLPETNARLQQGSERVLALGAVSGRYACGAAAALIDEDTAVLTDLFVDETIRRQGVGARLLDELLFQLRERGVTEVSAFYALNAEDTAAMDALLISRGFPQPEAIARNFKVDSRDFHNARLLGRAFRPDYRAPESVFSFAQLPSSALSILLDDDGIPSPLSWKENQHRAAPDLSMALVQEGEVVAYQLCGESADGGYILLAANTRDDAPASSFLTLLTALANRCYYHRGGDFPFYFSATTEHAERLALRLMDGQYTEYVEYGTHIPLSPQ